MIATAAPVFTLPAGLTAAIESARAAGEQIAKATRLPASFTRQIQQLQQATAELKRALNRVARRALTHSQRARNHAALQSFLQRLSLRARTHLGLLITQCAHTLRAAHDRNTRTHSQRTPLATCQAMNAPGLLSLCNAHSQDTRT